MANGPISADDKPIPKAVRSPGKIGVVDIGSNTVRLVVYDAPTRLPIPMFNEKAQCELGRSLGETNRLRPEGVAEALHSLARFTKLSQAMGVDQLTLVATAAVRDAEDGPEFVREIEKRFDCKVQVLSGEEEAKLAANGVISGVFDADGLLGDLGGGSLDFVALNNGVCGDYATMKLGHLRLLEESKGKTGKAASLVADELKKIDWIKNIKGRSFYAVGGSWRAIARLMIEQTHYPLYVIDNFTIDRDEALRLCRLISGLSAQSLDKIKSISKRRTETLPYAAAALRVILETAKPARVVFSGFGMREGQLIKSLPKAMQKQDPFVAGCMRFAERTGRFAISGEEIYDWLDPVFPDQTALQKRSRLAACTLSDIGWPEHPDYRAEHAFYRVLRMPFAGLSHPARVLLALAIYIRYNGDKNSALIEPVKSLLDEEQADRVEALGLGLRLAHTLSGSAPGLLSRTSLVIDDSDLNLMLPTDSEPYLSAPVLRRFKTFAKSVSRTAKIFEGDHELTWS